jgi:hypothetical protein
MGDKRILTVKWKCRWGWHECRIHSEQDKRQQTPEGLPRVSEADSVSESDSLGLQPSVSR